MLPRLTTALLALLLLHTTASATETEDEEDLTPLSPATEPASVQPPVSAPPLTADDPPVEPLHRETLQLLGGQVPPGTFETLYWLPAQSFRSIATPIPVLVAHGNNPGPRLCLTAAIHGDELNGIEMARRLMHDLNPQQLNGTVIAIPIVNMDGFRRNSRYLDDRRDLNRYFPGTAGGSYAQRIAHSLFDNVIQHCQFLVDLHTGSLLRTNLPQIRGDLKNNDVFAFSQLFGGITVLHGQGETGTLRRAATDADIPAVTMEAGGPNVLDESAVAAGVHSLDTLMQNLGMRKARRFWSAPQPVFYQSRWLRSEQGGILMSKVKLGDKVRVGQVLGTVVDPVSNSGSEILAEFHGRILGMAVNQFVQPGFAVYHVGVETPAEEVKEQVTAAETETTDTEEEETSGSNLENTSDANQAELEQNPSP